MLESLAQFKRPTRLVSVRLATVAPTIYLDLANDQWDTIAITAEGWQVVHDPPVRFVRSRGMLALPTPVRGGSLKALRPFVNLDREEDWALFASWLVMTLRPTGPYPVLVLGGQHGSAKSTTAEVARRLIDPNSAMLRAQPSDVRDLMIAATNGWLIALDNISKVPVWLSDALCRLSTGGGFSTRELYSDADEIIFASERPVLLNSIEPVVDRSDLLDRALLLNLPIIATDTRRSEETFWTDFEAARPTVLGALLDAVARAIKEAPTVHLEALPRMADFAIWMAAAAPALDWVGEELVAIYESNREAGHELALEASPVAAAVRAVADIQATQAAATPWQGTATELLGLLTDQITEEIRRLKAWPVTGHGLSRILRRLAPNLLAVGVQVTFVDDRSLGTRRRQITLQKVMGPERSERSAPPQPPSNIGQTGRNAQPSSSDPLRSGHTPERSGNAPPDPERSARSPGSAGNAQHLPYVASAPSAGNARHAGNATSPPLSGTPAARPAPCSMCRGRRFWRAKSGTVTCARCHPPPTPAMVAGWLEVVDADEVRPPGGGRA